MNYLTNNVGLQEDLIDFFEELEQAVRETPENSAKHSMILAKYTRKIAKEIKQLNS